MYLPSMTTEELVRYADTAATTELERELVIHATALLEDCGDNDKLQDQMFNLMSAGTVFTNAVRSVAKSLSEDDSDLSEALLDAIEKFEKETENAVKPLI